MKVRTSDLSHHEIQQLIGKQDESNPGPWPVILEIGANDGEDSIEFLHRFPDSNIFCFECDPRAIAKWKARIGDAPYVTLAEVALDSKAGVRKFYQSGGTPSPEYPDWDKSGSLLKPTGHLTYSPWCSFSSGLEVPCVRLDDYLYDHAPDVETIDFWRMDVQGAELRVMEGAPLALACTRYVQLECHDQAQMYEGAPREPEVLAFMAERDFRCLGRYANDLIFVNEDYL